MPAFDEISTLPVSFVEIDRGFPRRKVETIMVAAHIVPGDILDALFDRSLVQLPFIRKLFCLYLFGILGVCQIACNDNKLGTSRKRERERESR